MGLWDYYVLSFDTFRGGTVKINTLCLFNKLKAFAADKNDVKEEVSVSESFKAVDRLGTV